MGTEQDMKAHTGAFRYFISHHTLSGSHAQLWESPRAKNSYLTSKGKDLHSSGVSLAIHAPQASLADDLWQRGRAAIK